jgi:hypothetical protein
VSILFPVLLLPLDVDDTDYGLDHYWPSKTENVGMLVAKAGPQPIEANDIVVGFFDGFSLGVS